MRLIFISAILAIIVSSCQQRDAHNTQSHTPVVQTSYGDSFNDYWYAGKAEVSSYELTQARYGELRQGTATLIFVTEPFSKKKQVKLDRPQRAGDDKQTVMKLNFVKKFETGIYPYSMMLSSFTPVDLYNFSNSVKVTMSGQEWCGHVFSQMNLTDNNKYAVKSHSYFESEGDQSFVLERALLEDEVWNLIRLDYQSLPIGKIKIIPGLFATRLMHKALKPLEAVATLEINNAELSYTINYANGRTLAITFDGEFPHKILAWKETYKGLGGDELTTTGTLKESLYIDYWNKNSNADSRLRDSLGLK